MKINDESRRQFLKKTTFAASGMVGGITLPDLAQNKLKNSLTWEELAAQYECPNWFRDVKFGIWCHWGPQVVPESGGGWYARHMYMQDVGREIFGENAYPYHVNVYGHPSEFGFKDVINLWKAEKFDADSLIKFFKANGARYFVALANHHDHFDCFASTHHQWNSVNIGPKRDIVGEFKKASRKHSLYFGVTSHDNRHWKWWLPAFEADKYGEKEGIPYDGRMKKPEGKGKWWEGLDPANLYGPIPEKRTPELEKEMKENWLKRHLELVDKYEPDLLYYDSHGFSYGEYGKEVARRLYNNSLSKYDRIKAVMNIKSKMPGIVYDVERGGSSILEEKPWQSEITFASWFYKPDSPRRHNARTILEMLIDAVSKNGTLLLNVELRPDGTIPSVQREFIEIVGNWLRVNGEAIYETRPWKVFGDGRSIRGTEMNNSRNGVIGEAGADAANKKDGHHFNERTIESEPYAHDEVRFTTKGEMLYVLVINPAPGELIIPSLGRGDSKKPGKIKSVILLGEKQAVNFEQLQDKAIVMIPEITGNKYPIVLKIDGVL
jgi:alpha-L-fucosidase